MMYFSCEPPFVFFAKSRNKLTHFQFDKLYGSGIKMSKPFYSTIFYVSQNDGNFKIKTENVLFKIFWSIRCRSDQTYTQMTALDPSQKGELPEGVRR